MKGFLKSVLITIAVIFIALILSYRASDFALTGWIIILLFVGLIVYLGYKFIKWLTAPTYTYRIGNVIYETRNKELSEKELEVIKKENEKLDNMKKKYEKDE